MYKLELAKECELEKCYEIIDSGRAFQKEQGFIQWTDDYPSLEILKEDIKNEKGYVIKADGELAAYMCIDFDGEPAYDNIEGQWNADRPFAVVHRMAISERFRGKGLTGEAFKLIEELCIEKNVDYIRMDTDFPNKRMQHVMTKNGFKHCGVIEFQGSGKLAYDKMF